MREDECILGTAFGSPEVYRMLGTEPAPGPLSAEVVAQLFGDEDLERFAGLGDVDGVCGIDADGRITFTNQTMPALLRSEDQDLVGHRLHDIVHRDRRGHETHPAQACPFTAQFMESPGAVDTEFTAVTAPARCTARHLVEADGGDDLVTAIVVDRKVQFTGSPMTYAVEGDVGELDGVTHLLAYRLVQEAVRNAFTHSHGGRVRVSLNRTPSTLVLDGRDDGVGMGDPRSAPTHAGLRILRGRAETAGGSARFGAGLDGRGAGVEVRLPLLPSPSR